MTTLKAAQDACGFLISGVSRGMAEQSQGQRRSKHKGRRDLGIHALATVKRCGRSPSNRKNADNHEAEAP